MKVRCTINAVLVFLLAQGMGIAPPSFSQQVDTKHVLVLMLYSTARPVGATILQGLEKGLRSSYSGSLDVVTENLGPVAPEPQDFSEKISDWIAYKYGRVNFDAIVVVTVGPLHTAESLRDWLWPRAPLLLVLVEEEREQNPESVPHSTRVVAALDIKETLRSALQMLPATRRVALLGGSSAHDRTMNKDMVKSI